MRGRPPKPKTLKAIQGTYRPDRDPGGVGEGAGLPPCPVWLPVAAKREWRRICKEAKRTGLLTKLDRGLLTIYCQNWALLREAQEKGYISQLLRLQSNLIRCAMELGLSPAGRLKLRLPQPQPADELQEFLRGE